jgi:hypothetical protein
LGPGLNVHHIISRYHKATLTKDFNSLVLCPGDHKFFRGTAAHENPVMVALWMMINRPSDWYLLSEATKELIKSRGGKPYGIV